MADTRSARKRRSDIFFAETGNRPYSPEFIRSLIQTMRDPDACYTERVWAWNRWVAWGNMSRTPVSHWDPGKAFPLGQNDCALDLLWFLEGKKVSEIQDASLENRKKEYPRVRHLKNPTSRAHANLQARGLIDIQGHRTYLRDDPPADQEQFGPGSRDKSDFKRDQFHKDSAFIKYLTDSGSRDWDEWETAKKRYIEARQAMRSRYRKWRNPGQNADASLFTGIPTTNKDIHTHTVENVPLEANGVCVPRSVPSAQPETAIVIAQPKFDQQAAWTEFWQIYSTRNGQRRVAAHNWWTAHVLVSQHATDIMAGIHRHIPSRKWTNGYAPDAITFLSERQYLDTPRPAPAASKHEEKKARVLAWAQAQDEAERNGGQP